MWPVGWPQTATIIGVITAVIGLQTFWIARALDALRGKMHRGFDRVDARLDRIEGREPPSLRRV
jgi:hypothetical protein